MTSVERDAYDENGVRHARCTNCETTWIEDVKPVELFTGVWTTAGERPHECPEPFDLEVARAVVSMSATCGVPVHPETYARCVLAYKAAGLWYVN